MTTANTTLQWLHIQGVLLMGDLPFPTGTTQRLAEPLAWELDAWIDSTAGPDTVQAIDLEQVANELGADPWDILLLLTISLNHPVT